MSLINCKECGGIVSDQAAFCPHCGYPVNKSDEQTVSEPEPVKEPEPIIEPEPVREPEPVVVEETVLEPDPVVVEEPEPAKPEPEPEPAKPEKKEICPESHLAKAIVFTCVLFMPFGIPGIVNAAKVRPAYNRGKMDAAKRYSRNAQKWCTLSLIFGIIFWILFITAIVLIACLA